jgi:hypothetical protein
MAASAFTQNTRGEFMKKATNWMMLFAFAMVMAGAQLITTTAYAQSTYFTSRGCVNCHSAPVAATCAGCHQHSGTLTATKNKTTSYAPGETVSITLSSSGARAGWIGVRLYDQSGVEIARATGTQSGMGGSAVYPAVLSAPAPATAGTYAWRIAYFGNNNGTGTGDVHSEKSVNVSVVVAATAPPADTTAPTVSAFTLPAASTTLSVPVSSLTATDNTAVTGYLVNTSATKPLATAAGWNATAPTSVTAPAAGTVTFYAWAKDAAGNVSAARSAAVVITINPVADTVKPTLTVSTLANGAITSNPVLNVSGRATDNVALDKVTVNASIVPINADGTFSTALTLNPGGNIVSVVAVDKAGNSTTNSRTVTYQAVAPTLTISAPADNLITARNILAVKGTTIEHSTVTVTVNGRYPQVASMSGTAFTASVYLVRGINTIAIKAVDPAGHISNAKRTVTYDGTRPTLAVTAPSQDIVTKNPTMILKGTVADNLSAVTIRITMDGKTYQPVVTNGAFSQALTFSTAKEYSIVVTARDAAGNRSSVTRNVIFQTATSSGHPFGWTSPRSSHPDYVEANGVSSCISCHSTDPASQGRPMSCYNCHGKEW